MSVILVTISARSYDNFKSKDVMITEIYHEDRLDGTPSTCACGEKN